MTALPALYPRLESHGSSTICGAYRVILDLEKTATNAAKPEHLIYARILGYLILEGPGDQAGAVVASEVLSCNTEAKIFDLGKMYLDYYLRVFRKYKGRTPTHSGHVSRPSLDTIQDMLKAALIQAPEDHKTAKQNALIRDGWRCVVSGLYDKQSVDCIVELQQQVLDAGVTVKGTQCAHIFPEFINQNIVGNEGSSAKAKADYASSVWAIMDRFGCRNILNDLNGKGIHNLTNVMTLGLDAHDYFDQLELWFEPTVADNTYRVKYAKPWYRDAKWQDTITFTTPDPEKLPVPNPAYLNLHAACARVANLSGAGEHIDKLLRDLEDTRVLAKDGGSAAALEYALKPLVGRDVTVEA